MRPKTLPERQAQQQLAGLLADLRTDRECREIQTAIFLAEMAKHRRHGWAATAMLGAGIGIDILLHLASLVGPLLNGF